MRIFLLLISLTLFASCKTYSEDEIAQFDKEIKAYIAKNKLQLTESESGLYYRIDEIGDGEFIQAKDSIFVAYKGYLLDGTVFDYHKKAIGFRVDNLIAGWKEVLYKMKMGGKAFLIVPPQLGYGDRKMDDIPENSILVYSLSVEKVL